MQVSESNKFKLPPQYQRSTILNALFSPKRASNSASTKRTAQQAQATSVLAQDLPYSLSHLRHFTEPVAGTSASFGIHSNLNPYLIGSGRTPNTNSDGGTPNPYLGNVSPAAPSRNRYIPGIPSSTISSSDEEHCDTKSITQPISSNQTDSPTKRRQNTRKDLSEGSKKRAIINESSQERLYNFTQLSQKVYNFMGKHKLLNVQVIPAVKHMDTDLNTMVLSS